MAVLHLGAGVLQPHFLLRGEDEILPGVGGVHPAGRFPQVVGELTPACLTEQSLIQLLCPLPQGQALSILRRGADLAGLEGELDGQSLQAYCRIEG